MDETSPPSSGSPLSTLNQRRGHIEPGTWPESDVVFVEQALRGYVGVASLHLGGIGRLLLPDVPIYLHPLVTLLRGVAEAVGRLWWVVEPWLNDEGLDDDITEGAWDLLSRPILARAELAHLDELRKRRTRFAASYGDDSNRYSDAAAAISALRDDLTRRHGRSDGAEQAYEAVVSEPFKLSGRPRTWCLCGESLPMITDLVTAATEYAYGQRARGSGMNPYPMYSGFAHASLETIFAHFGKAASTVSEALAADDVELRRIVGMALRTFASGYEIASHALGRDLGELRAWEAEFEPQITG